MGVVSRVWACSKLSHRERADDDLDGVLFGIDPFKVDNDRGVDQAAQRPGTFRHEECCFATRLRRDPT